MSEKISAAHRERAALVYVRQSTREQLLHNHESRRRQYNLTDHARQLGFSRVTVIDDDLGRSGSGAVERPGFGKLLAAVCQGIVGAVFALEASRLARNNRDWHHLLELCALTQTIVVDHDGVYDPQLLNDRLLLGLKGTMSEFELALLRQRAQEARLSMIKRGEVLWLVPAGYVRTDDNGCEMTPDRQIQQAIRGVFTKFRELGSARQVLLWYRAEKLLLPVVQPDDGGVTRWKAATYGRVLKILKNPIYAGAFVYGRKRTQSVMRDGRLRKTSGHDVPVEEWEVLIRDHHQGYISWDDFVENQVQLEDNAAMQGKMTRGAAKNGTGLLAGLLRCHRCGRKLHVAYSGSAGNVVRYHCRGGMINHGTANCISFGGRKIDREMATHVLEVLGPHGVEAAMEAWNQIRQRESTKLEALRLTVEKARYEAGRIHRQFDAVEPENRLVAGELESRWNSAIRQVNSLEQRLNDALAEAQKSAIVSSERHRLLDLGRDLTRAWNHPQASMKLKKRILRTIIEEIVADVVDEPPKVLLRIHWVGGNHTTVSIAKPRSGRHRRCTSRDVVELVRELAKVCDDAAIARLLNRLGYRTGADNTWTEPRVRSLRCYNKIAVFDRSKRREWVTLKEAATVTGVSAATIRRLVRRGLIPGQQVVYGAPWVIQRSDLEDPEVQATIHAVKNGTAAPRAAPGQRRFPFTKAL